MKNKGLKKFFAVFLSAAMSLSVFATPVLAETTEESATENAEENVSDVKLPVSGYYGNLKWEIDTNGTLTISGSGDYTCDYEIKVNGWGGRVPEWCQYGSQIKKAVVSADELTSTACMFACCSNLTSIEFGDSFNTTNVTNMGSMFDGCSVLTC